ncbi:MAG: hypothetical protein PHP98_11255 [Kiritimatiellae bacterium]|jgi:hypothetical protein|nr:hypothetical protein [Kiritimatiellia bacterium]
MSISGWILLILSWGLIIALNVFCFAKALGGKDDGDDPQNGPASSGI